MLVMMVTLVALLLFLLTLPPLLVRLIMPMWFQKIRNVEMNTRIISRVATTHHERVVDGLEVAVHISAQPLRLSILNPLMMAKTMFTFFVMIIQLASHCGSGVVSRKSDDPHAMLVLFLMAVGRA